MTDDGFVAIFQLGEESEKKTKPVRLDAYSVDEDFVSSRFFVDVDAVGRPRLARAVFVRSLFCFSFFLSARWDMEIDDGRKY